MTLRWSSFGPGRARQWLLAAIFAILAVNIAAWPAAAGGKLPVLIQFSIQDENGNFFYEGEIEFCTPDGECIFADIEPGFPGHFFLPSAALEPGVPYTVFVYDPKVTVLFEMRGWTFNPDDYDPGHNSYWELDQFLIFPNFKAHDDRRLTFHLETTLNPEWQVVAGLGYADDDFDNLPDWPEFMASVQGAFMVGGKFTSDENAAGGVSKVKPGFGLAGAWRSRYPRVVPERDARVSFRELRIAYEQNRYGTLGKYYPGRDSDVTFHRLIASYGVGLMDQSMFNHYTVALAVGFGGIYDGSSVLHYQDRRYLLMGIGLQARYTHELFDTERLNIGLTGQLEWMYYPGGDGEDDFWFGSAPSASVGFTVY